MLSALRFVNNGVWFEWFQLVLFIWYSIRSAALMRLPWVLIAGCFVGSRKDWGCRRFVLLHRSAHMSDTISTLNKHDFTARLRESTPYVNSLQTLGNKQYLISKAKFQDFLCIKTAMEEGLPIYGEALKIGIIFSVARLATPHEAVLCLIHGGGLTTHEPGDFYVVEHCPLRETKWLSKVLQGIPLFLTAKGYGTLSAVVTLVFIAADFMYNWWEPIAEEIYKCWMRLWQLLIGTVLGLSSRYVVFVLLGVIDDRYLPSNPVTVRLGYRKWRKVLVRDGFWTDLAITKKYDVPNDWPSISPGAVITLPGRKLRLVFTIHSINEPTSQVFFSLDLKGVLFDKVAGQFNMPLSRMGTYLTAVQYALSTDVGCLAHIRRSFGFYVGQCFNFDEIIQMIWNNDLELSFIEFDETSILI